MRSWLIMLAGLLLWAVHFFALYLIGEFAGDSRLSRAAILALTLLCIGVALRVLIWSRRETSESFDRWRMQTSQAGLVLGILAILFQALPAILAH